MEKVATTKEALSDPSFAAAMSLVINCLMKRMGVDEIEVNPLLECANDNGGAAVNIDRQTGVITIKRVEGSFPEEDARLTNEFGHA